VQKVGEFEWYYYESPENKGYMKGCDSAMGSPLPLQRKFALYLGGKLSREEAKKLAESPDCLSSWELFRINESVASLSFKNNKDIHGIDSSDLFRYSLEELFSSEIGNPTFSQVWCYIVRPDVRKKYCDILDVFVKSCVRYRIYGLLTGLYDDTEIEKYHRVLNMLESGIIGQFECIYGCLGNHAQCYGLKYVNRVRDFEEHVDDLMKCSKYYFKERPEYEKAFVIPITLSIQEWKLRELKSLFDRWHSEERKDREAGNKAFNELKKELVPFTNAHPSDTETELVFVDFEKNVALTKERKKICKEEREEKNIKEKKK
jgi:hypothetical protein